MRQEFVFVLNKDGKPLMPSKRFRSAKLKIKQGLAKKVCSNPYTIQLLYDTPDATQPLILGIDPGRTNIGIAVIRETGEKVFDAKVGTRNKEIPELMRDRKTKRQQHRRLKRRTKRIRRAKKNHTLAWKRHHQKPEQSTLSDKSVETGILDRRLPQCEKDIHCVGIRNKESRFCNRKRPAGWLTPTANQLLQTHINVAKKIAKFLPITDVVLEVNKFAFMALDNPNIKKWEFQHGALYGYSDLHAAVDAQQDCHCIFCKQPIAHYHHIIPRSKGGSDTIDNIAGVCTDHHELMHKDDFWTAKMAKNKAGLNKKYGALSVLNQIIKPLTEELAKEYPEHAFLTDGRSTKAARETYDFAKDHNVDAYCIALSILPNANTISRTNNPYRIVQFRRHDRQCCQQAMTTRKYYDTKGNLVAKNRHKAIEQKDDSLAEYLAAGNNPSALIVPKHEPVYKDRNRIMPGALMRCGKTIFVMNSSKGRHDDVPDYYISTSGQKYRARKCTPIVLNKGLVFC